MSEEQLPDIVLEGVIGYVRHLIEDEMAVPGRTGKKLFLKNALPRDDFFPEDLQREIDSRRGGKPQPEYLFSHFQFDAVFGRYR
jgi:hypothetical protein